MKADELELEIDPEHFKQFGPCECCGNMTNRVWDFIYWRDTPTATYFVEWTPDHPNNAANFDFIFGQWGEGTTSADRKSISVAYRCIESGPSFMVIDSASRPVSQNTLVGSATTREQVLNSDLREITFALCDVVYLHDPRIDELRAAPLKT